jgi:hypothetical protein
MDLLKSIVLLVGRYTWTFLSASSLLSQYLFAHVDFTRPLVLHHKLVKKGENRTDEEAALGVTP